MAPDPAAVAGATNRSNAGNDKPATARIAIPVNDAINADTPGSVVWKSWPSLINKNPAA